MTFPHREQFGFVSFFMVAVSSLGLSRSGVGISLPPSVGTGCSNLTIWVLDWVWDDISGVDFVQNGFEMGSFFEVFILWLYVISYFHVIGYRGKSNL
jgi:hypothetical protein